MVTKGSHRSTRERLLDAASRLVNRSGPSHLTIDQIAEEAGVSRGGLLYHFRDREAILGGLLDQTIETFCNKLRAYRNEHPGSGAFTRAYLNTLGRAQPSGVNASIAAAALSAPELLDPIRTHRAEWQERTEKDDIDPVEATIVRLAIDGLWLTEMLGVSSISPDMRAAVLARLEDRTTR